MLKATLTALWPLSVEHGKKIEHVVKREWLNWQSKQNINLTSAAKLSNYVEN